MLLSDTFRMFFTQTVEWIVLSSTRPEHNPLHDEDASKQQPT